MISVPSSVGIIHISYARAMSSAARRLSPDSSLRLEEVYSWVATYAYRHKPVSPKASIKGIATIKMSGSPFRRRRGNRYCISYRLPATQINIEYQQEAPLGDNSLHQNTHTHTHLHDGL